MDFREPGGECKDLGEPNVLLGKFSCGAPFHILLYIFGHARPMVMFLER